MLIENFGHSAGVRLTLSREGILYLNCRHTAGAVFYVLLDSGVFKRS